MKVLILSPLIAAIAVIFVASAVSCGLISSYVVPTSRFTRTDWVQPGATITRPVYAPVTRPVYSTIAVAGPTAYSHHIVENAPLVVNERRVVSGVSHVPVSVQVPAQVPVQVQHVQPLLSHYAALTSPLVSTYHTNRQVSILGYKKK